MKQFVLTILGFFGIPLLLLLVLFLWSDPFKTLHPFDLSDADVPNREYQSVELFLRNNPTYHYNAFMFCSSQGSGLNTYTWKMYLPEGSETYVCQAWAETITGVRNKMVWLDKEGANLEHVLVMVDIPGFFGGNQVQKSALSLPHYKVSGQSKWQYHAYEYYNYIQRPSCWIEYARDRWYHVKKPFGSDTITNDYFVDNRYNYDAEPKQDSLCNCSEVTRRTFMAQINSCTEADVVMSKPVITAQNRQVMEDMKTIFDKHHTDYRIIVTPSYRYVHPYLNTEDLAIMQDIFGEDRIYDFTTDRDLTSDFNDFFDPVHFGTRLGWFMLKKIYED